MIGEMMRECRNYFEDGNPVEGEFKIASKKLDGFPDGFIAIKGSQYHDGVWRIVSGVLDGAPECDQDFDGWVFTLHPPKSFIAIADRASEYVKNTPVNAVVTQTFGSYSRTLASGKNGILTWKEAFADQLAPYRRMYTEVGV